MRLRMKIFDDKTTGRRYLVSMGMFISQEDVVRVYLMSDEETRYAAMTVEAYNALPYYYFKEDGPAPRPELRFANQRIPT